jgi:hypothetical protein
MIFFKEYSIKITFNFQFKLKTFRILSMSTVQSAKYPFNLDESKQDNADDDYENYSAPFYDDTEEDDGQTIIDTNKHDKYDDDERFIIIEDLNLSHNLFSLVNIEHMFQTIKNIVYLDFSSNPLEKVYGMSGDALIMQNKLNSTTRKSSNNNNNNPPVESSNQVVKEILCIDELDMSNCKLERIPNLQHSCINKIDLSRNIIKDRELLVLSNYTVYFLDYLNLQGNSITNLKFVTSGQKFVQDTYLVQNSPLNYFYGGANTSQLNHTIVDVRSNRNFNCDCDLVKTLDDMSYLKLMSDCLTSQFIQQCRRSFANEDNNQTGTTNIRMLNKKLRAIFVITCLVLSLLCILIIYYMCSDFIRNVRPYDHVRVLYNRVLVYLKLRRRYDTTPHAHRDSGSVAYSKLVNDGTSVSQIEINS